MQANSILKNGSLYVLGNLFNKAIAFITVPIFTRLLTQEEYGIVNTYTSWVSLLAVIVGLSLGNSIRNAYLDMHDEMGEYISSIFNLAFINFIGICIILFLIKNHLNFPKELIFFCLIESFFNFIINAIIIRYIMEECAIKRTLLLILPNLSGAIFSIILISALPSNKYYGRIMATSIITVIFGSVIMLYYMIRFRNLFNLRYWKYALPISIPLIFHGISCNILGTSDRSIITYYCGPTATGIYSLIYNLSMVSNVLTSSAEAVWIPRMTLQLQKKDYKKFNYDVGVYIYTILFAFCGLLTFAPELIIVLGGKEYLAGAKMIFPIVSSAFVIFIYSIYVNIEYFYKKTRMIAIATMIAAGLNIVLNFIFVPKFGAVAAAYTTLSSYVISFILHSLNSKRIDAAAVPYKMLIIPILIIITSGAITYWTFNYVTIRWGVMITLGIIYIGAILKKYRKA